MEDVLTVILYLMGFCTLLFLTYVTTRYIGGKQSRAMKGKNINILETVPLGMDKRIHLIKAGKQYVLIASTSKTIEFLTIVDLEDSASEQEMITKEEGSLFDFKSIFEKYASTYRTKKVTGSINKKAETPQNIGEGSDFRFNLSRLKAIVQKNECQINKNGDDSTNEK